MRVVACEIFRAELESVAPDAAKEALWLPCGLHVDMPKLGEALRLAALQTAKPVFLFGDCHPDIDALAKQCGGCRTPGKDCVALFLSPDERKAFESRKAFIMTPGWLKHWREIFQRELGWDNFDARLNFSFYDLVILLDFGLEPLDELEILEFFDFVGKPVEVVPATLDRFKLAVAEVMGDSNP